MHGRQGQVQFDVCWDTCAGLLDELEVKIEWCVRAVPLVLVLLRLQLELQLQVCLGAIGVPPLSAVSSRLLCPSPTHPHHLSCVLSCDSLRAPAPIFASSKQQGHHR